MAHFLVVDDDRAAANGLSRLLRDDGHGVAAFTEAKDAIRALAAGSFDFVIIDLEMPDVGGESVLRVARHHQPGACCVVVSVRAAHHFRDLLASGACIVADKPIDYVKLLSLLEGCRGGRTGETHQRAFLASGFSSELLVCASVKAR